MTFKAIIPAAGKGTRLRPLTETLPKALIPVNGQPLVTYIMDKALSLGVKELIVIVNFMKETIMETLGTQFKGVPIKYVEQKELKGLAHAISMAESYIDDFFIVLLGDEIYKNTSHSDLLPFLKKYKPDVICGIMEESNEATIKKNYTVKLDGNKIVEIIEKPKTVFNHYIGVGTWLFNSKVFNYIRKTPPSSLRNEIELADVIQNMINDGLSARACLLRGEYVNVNSYDDLRLIEEKMRNN
jgi:glucose-1-phosphate thymidylyltransferase